MDERDHAQENIFRNQALARPIGGLFQVTNPGTKGRLSLSFLGLRGLAVELPSLPDFFDRACIFLSVAGKEGDSVVAGTSFVGWTGVLEDL